MEETYWLYTWLDSHGIRNAQQAGLALRRRKVVDDLREQAFAATREQGQEISKDSYSLMAARGLDLSGELCCPSPSCRRVQVDQLFSHAWHYFDRIVIADSVADEVLSNWAYVNGERFEWLIGHIDIALYLRQLGAENLITFRRKGFAGAVPEYTEHTAAADPLLLSARTSGVQELTELLSLEGEFTRVFDPDQLSSFPPDDAVFRFDHADEKRRTFASYALEDVARASTEALKRGVTSRIALEYFAHLVADLKASVSLGMPIGATLPLYHRMLGRSPTPSPADVAFALELPVLTGVSIEALLRIRADEQDSFYQFRDSLHLAIKERLRTLPSHTAGQIADEIRMDVIDPELRNIRSKLSSANRILARKTTLGIGLGTLSTICGLIAGAAPAAATAAGVAALSAAAMTGGFKQIEQNEDVRLSDMYFLWKAMTHGK
jgi:hypothetical protein